MLFWILFIYYDLYIEKYAILKNLLNFIYRLYLIQIFCSQVGVFGYIAFYDKNIAGNILILLTPSIVTEFIKLGFILTVAVSFPLCLFPCRSSLHSLLFKQVSVNYHFCHHSNDIEMAIFKIKTQPISQKCLQTSMPQDVCFTRFNLMQTNFSNVCVFF